MKNLTAPNPIRIQQNNPHELSETHDHSQAETRAETWIDRTVPWASSFLMHAALGLIGAFALYAAIRPATVEKYDQPISIRDTVDPQIAGPTADTEQFSTLNNNLKTIQNLLKDAPKDGSDPWGSPNLVVSTMSGLGHANQADAPFITSGADGKIGVAMSGISGNGPGRLAAWGPHLVLGGTSILPTSKAKKTVYLLDHSGSMLDSFDYLRQEVITATKHLSAFQQFSVIMFSEDVTVLGPNQLQRASEEAKRDLAHRISTISAKGQNDGLLEPFQKGFEKAFAMKPEVIIFLTDGQFDSRLVDIVNRLNTPGPHGEKVQVHTIAYIQIDPEAAESLKKIATQNNGRYKFVGPKDLK